MVLGGFGYQPHAFKDVGNIIYSSLLHLQRLRGLVQVQNAVRRSVEKVTELLGQGAQGGFWPALSRERGAWGCGRDEVSYT